MVERKLELKLKLIAFELVIYLVLLGISVYYVVRNIDNCYLLTRIWLQLLVYCVVHLITLAHYTIAITRSSKVHIFIALFPVVLTQSLFEVGFSFYMIYLSSSLTTSAPVLVFLVSLFSYKILDSSYILLLQASLLLGNEKTTRVLSKMFRARLGLIIVMDVAIITWILLELISDNSKIVSTNIIFLIIYLVQTVLVSLYLKQTLMRVLDEENLPEIDRVQQAAIVMRRQAMEEYELNVVPGAA